ncbi:MAG: hypothetical protein JW822_05580, partial [Spirochaetales bacterium]|nr:hypothetical protein [Spirochaetales bacterium]
MKKDNIINLSSALALFFQGKKLIIIITLLFLTYFAFAVDYTWTGGGGDNNWSNGGNWTGFGYPDGNDDRALFTGAGGNVTVNVVATIGELTINAGVNPNITQSNALTITNTGGHSGNFTIRSGTFANNAALTVAGTTTIGIGAGNSITLNNAGNNFQGNVDIDSCNNLTLNDINAINLNDTNTSGNLSVSGNLNITAGGNITQGGGNGLLVTGTTVLNAGANNITLTNVNNDFNPDLTVTGNNVSLYDADPLEMNTSTITGNLTVTCNGYFRDNGAISVTGTTTINTNGGEVVLDVNTNNFGGAVSISNATTVTLNDTNDIILGAISAANNLTVTAGIGGAGSITNNGALLINGNSSFTVPNNGDIIVDNAGNTFTGTLDFNASAGTISDIAVVDTTAVDLQAL